MLSRKGFVLALTTLATTIGAAGVSLALVDDDSKTHKVMEQVQTKNAFISKNVRTAAVFKKNQKEVVEAAKALAQLGKDVREETVKDKKNNENKKLWTDLIDSYVKESEKFAETAGKEGADQAEVKKAFGAVGATCKACHDDFRPDE